MVAGSVSVVPSGRPISGPGLFLCSVVAIFVGSSNLRTMADGQPATGGTNGKRQHSVRGRVFDNGGKPLANAAVHLGPYRSLTGRIVKRRSTKTDDAGRFEIDGLEPVKETAIVVIAENKAADAKRIQVDRNTEVEFTLDPSPVLKLRVVDAAGKPKEGAIVVGGVWRASYLPLDLRTDREGRVVWTAAPEDAVEYSIKMPGFIEPPTFSIVADGQEQNITLPPSIIVEGTVTDASTRMPIERFKWIPIEGLADGKWLTAQPGAGGPGEAGRFHIEWCKPESVFRLRIEADGYRTAMTDEFRLGQPDATCAVALQPAPAIRGNVVDTGGNPVANAAVSLATPTLRVWIPKPGAGEYRTTTDDSGTYTFPAQFETYSIAVVSDRGFATVTRSAEDGPGKLTVQPWGQIEGLLTQRGKPVARHGVGLRPLRNQTETDPQINYGEIVETDEQGRFEFPRVPPGKYSLRASISIWDAGPLDSSDSVPIEIEPGQRIVRSLGGDGATVVGRAAVAGATSGSLNYNWSINSLVARQIGIEVPRELRRAGVDLAATWNPAWQNAEEGFDYLDARRNWFVRLKTDGAFQISGVPPGHYDLSLRVYEPPPQGGGCLFTPIATRIIPVVVSKGSGELDLGTIELEAAETLKIGDAVPAIQFVTLDGKAARLSDLKGKLVFIDFWASWCAPCLSQMPAVQRLHKRFENDNHVVILGLNLDIRADTAKRLITRREITCRQGLLGNMSNNLTMSKLGISSIPAYILVAADGTLAYRGTNWDEAVRQLEARLAP